jgi:hypothetical protein
MALFLVSVPGGDSETRSSWWGVDNEPIDAMRILDARKGLMVSWARKVLRSLTKLQKDGLTEGPKKVLSARC